MHERGGVLQLDKYLPSQLSSAISASILPIEPHYHNQTIHMNHVNGLVMIFRFCS